MRQRESAEQDIYFLLHAVDGDGNDVADSSILEVYNFEHACGVLDVWCVQVSG